MGMHRPSKKGNTVWISGQLGHDEKGVLAKGMEEQLKQTYRNAQKVLEEIGETVIQGAETIPGSGNDMPGELLQI